MDQRMIFYERLGELKSLAEEYENVLSKEQVREFFSGTPLEEEHFELIFQYLEQQKIRVAESRQEAERIRQEQEAGSKSLRLYLEELEKLDEGGEGPSGEVFARAVLRDEVARKELIDWYLPFICRLAGENESPEIPAEDLIQEGNLGLLTALDELEELESAAAYQAFLLNKISRAMEQALLWDKKEKEFGEKLAGRAERLHQAARNLEEELEHKVSAEELSAFLDIPLEEIQDLMRMSADQIGMKEDK